MFPHASRRSLFLLTLAICLLPVAAQSTDVDGPDDCERTLQDFGDAPEGVDAYPGKLGAFPTCTANGPTGTQESACLPALSSPPGPAGAVVHVTNAGEDAFWLGCGPAGGPILGIDTESDGKTNAGGGPTSACNDAIAVDCVEAAWGLSFGQDECYGSTDAGIASPLFFTTCQLASFDFQTYNCGPNDQTAFLNVLVDMNEDADWNDNFQCPGGACAYEWAVKNVPIVIPPGCNTLTTPNFLIGPAEGRAWLRITISAESVSDEFPWLGTYTAAGPGQISNGETEDYPVFLQDPYDPCKFIYHEFGDAPEEALAYPGVPGRFPTCTDALIDGGSQNVDCTPISTPPAMAGFVKHTHLLESENGFWLGCPDLSIPFAGVDADGDGKTNDTGGPISLCNDPNEATDCVEGAFGLTFGQDECYADEDAGLDAPPDFQTCTDTSFEFEAFSCAAAPQTVFLNVLIDMNEDADWNDNFLCPDEVCAYEWAVKNAPIILDPGCGTYDTPTFRLGPNGVDGWMRITLTQQPVDDDFPWNGSAAASGETFQEGETEDYPIDITEVDPCPAYRDYGDAPEDAQAYPGVLGHFPTCGFSTAAGTMEHACAGAPLGTAPGLTGFVRHARLAGDPIAFWLGCGNPALPHPGVDGESDGQVNDNGGPASACSDLLPVDCVETAFGIDFGQDECTGDEDAGLGATLEFKACSPESVTFTATNCGATAFQAYLNVLVDWNQDADWNDSFVCPEGCAYEWAVKNQIVSLLPGCNTYVSPTFLAGPNSGNGWLRITLSPGPATDDFPWAGTALVGSQEFRGGETEDYPVTISEPDSCDISYEDFGDAPEEIEAYPNVIGNFPTCLFDSGPGTQEIRCDVADGTAPGLTGFVRHLAAVGSGDQIWLGCGLSAIDSEKDGKVSQAAASLSACDPNVLVDCVEATAGGDLFGQDECYGDLDSGLPLGPVAMARCSLATVEIQAFNCTDAEVDGYLNILVDWTQDGDWNDNALCDEVQLCAHEWAVKNKPITLNPGCNTFLSPDFRVGPKIGTAWMRVTISVDPATDDFPWAGSKGMVGDAFRGGETEDYPVEIIPSLIDVPAPQEFGELRLAPPVPNPANGQVMLRYTLPTGSHVRLDVVAPNGRLIRTLENGPRDPGEHVVDWSFRDQAGRMVPAGVYLIRLRVGDVVLTQRAVRTQR